LERLSNGTGSLKPTMWLSWAIDRAKTGGGSIPCAFASSIQNQIPRVRRAHIAKHNVIFEAEAKI
jgi:hypothetical protein